MEEIEEREVVEAMEAMEAIESSDKNMPFCEKVRHLVDCFKDANKKYRHGNTLLHYDIDAGCVDSVRKLIANRYVDINSINKDGNSPLHLAVAISVEMVRVFFESPRKVNINTRNNNGDTALDCAKKARNAKQSTLKRADYDEIIRMLTTLLDRAAISRVEMVGMFCESARKVNMNTQNNNGDTVLDYAKKARNAEEPALKRADCDEIIRPSTPPENSLPLKKRSRAASEPASVPGKLTSSGEKQAIPTTLANSRSCLFHDKLVPTMSSFSTPTMLNGGVRFNNR